MARVATLDTTQLAKLLDITPRHVRNLVAAGVLERARDEEGKELQGRYAMVQNNVAYIRYLRKQSKLDNTSETAYQSARNAKITAEARTAQLKLGVMENRLHMAEDVEWSITTMITAARSRLLAIPSRCARLLIGATKGKEFQEIFDLLMSEIRSCLKELSGYNAMHFASKIDKRVKELGGDSLTDGDSDTGPAGNGATA